MDSDTDAPKSKTPKKENKKKKDVPPQPDRIEVAVEVVHEHPNKTAPVVGYFPSGYDPVKNHASGSSPSEFQLYRHRNMSKRMQFVVRPPGSSVEFVGTSFSGEAAAGHRAMFALGLLHKEAGTLKIVPIAGNKIFRLEPKVKGVVDAGDNEPANSTLEEMTPQQKIAETTAIWGTKKDIEKAKKKLALKQDEDPNSQRNLNVKMKNVSVKKSALQSTESHVSRNIPPYDTSATTPQEAYVLDKIILTGEWNYLEDIYKKLHQEEKADFSSYPTFVRNRVEGLRKIEDESEKRKLSCIFSYINHLIKFKDQHSFDVFTAKGHKIPNILRHKFSNMFAVSELRRLPPEKISLLISYVLVLTLFADNFRTYCSDIAKDLSMNVLAVRHVYEQLGCKLIRQKSSLNDFCANLSVPLIFPRELKEKKRKR